MIRQEEVSSAQSKRPLAATMALGFVYLGWLIVALSPVFGFIAFASPAAIGLGAIVSVFATAIAGAFFVVFGEACLAIFRLVEIRA